MNKFLPQNLSEVEEISKQTGPAINSVIFGFTFRGGCTWG
jgi:hypothetical protein